MKKTVLQFISMMLAIAVLLVSYHGVYASSSASPLQASKVYYVSPTGNDANSDIDKKLGEILADLKGLQN